MANISAIKLPDGVTYNLVDRVSTIDVATTSANGLMSSSDKTKLNGIESGAEKNVITAIYGSDDLHAYTMPYLRFTKANGGYEYATTYVGVKNLIDARGFITTETDPVFTASPAHGISAQDIADWNGKQAALISGTNIKTVNNESLLGSGNISTPAKNVWYGTCQTSSSAYTKVVTTTSGDFGGNIGDVLIVMFDEGLNSVDSIDLVIDGTDYFLENTSPTYTQAMEYGSTTAVTFVVTDDEGYTVSMADHYIGLYAESLEYEKQDRLVSGTNIKTINGTSVLGSGDIAVGGDSNVQSDWNEADSTDDAYIKNKPTIPTKNIWYGTCSTASSTFIKTVTTTSGDFTLATGNIVVVKFVHECSDSSGSTNLNVDGTGSKFVAFAGTTGTSGLWRDGEVVEFVYDGSNFVITEGGHASTSYWGVTKLSSSVSSTAQGLSATPYAVKQAYDLAADSTEVPTASKKAEFDSNAHMNSTDMTTQDVSDFVDGLNVHGGGVAKTNVTPTSGTNYSGYGNCYYEVFGKLVHFHVGISGLTANTSTTIYTMPSGLRPSTTMAYKGSGGNTDSTSHLFANATGTITVNSPQQYAIGDIWYFAS